MNVQIFYVRVYLICINIKNNNINVHIHFEHAVRYILEEESGQKKVRWKVQPKQRFLTMMRGRSTKHGYSRSQTHGRSNFLSKKYLKCYHYDNKGHLNKDC